MACPTGAERRARCLRRCLVPVRVIRDTTTCHASECSGALVGGRAGGGWLGAGGIGSSRSGRLPGRGRRRRGGSGCGVLGARHDGLCRSGGALGLVGGLLLLGVLLLGGVLVLGRVGGGGVLAVLDDDGLLFESDLVVQRDHVGVGVGAVAGAIDRGAGVGATRAACADVGGTARAVGVVVGFGVA